MSSCSIWFSAPSFWMGGGLESRCVGRVCGADGAAPETCRAKNTSIKLPSCIKLAFHFISCFTGSSTWLCINVKLLEIFTCWDSSVGYRD